MLRPIVFIFALMWQAFPAQATVFEFFEDGSVEIHEANSFVPHHKSLRPFLEKSVFPNRGKQFDTYIKKAAAKYEVDENLIHAVIKTESSYNPDAVSPKGAVGLMQLMPATARAYGVKDSFLAEDNIEGGTRYLRDLLVRYQGDISLSVAAYNAGEGAVDKYQGIPPYDETIRYVEKVNRYYEEMSSQ